MFKQFNLSITQQFLLFFFGTSIVPVLIIGMLFYQSIDERFNTRIQWLLDSGGVVVNQIYRNDLKELSIPQTGLSALLQGKSNLTPSDVKLLESILAQSQQQKDLDFFRLYDVSGQLKATSSQISFSSQKDLLQAALAGRRAKSVEYFLSKPGLAYIAVSPVLSNGKVIGAILAGQNLADRFASQDLTKTLPGVDMRIYTPISSSQSTYALAYTTLPDAEKSVHVEQMAQYKNYPLKASEAKSTKALQERIGKSAYRSKAIVIENYRHQPVAYVILSTRTRLGEIRNQNLVYLTLYILFGISAALLAGAWFKRRFINPFNLLFEASRKVTRGDLKVRVEQESGQKEIRQTLSGFNQMIGRLQEDEQLRHTFVSTLTHDLRTPLIAQKRVLKVYQHFEQQLPGEMVPMNRQLLQNNEHLLLMVNSLLQAYQYEAGKVELAPSRFSVRELASDCIEAIWPLAQEKQIAIENRVPESLAVEADRGQVKQIYQNLLANSLEHLEPGNQVFLEGQTWGNTISLTVKDNGPGISPDLLPFVFKRYLLAPSCARRLAPALDSISAE